jgi:hypothetical protein
MKYGSSVKFVEKGFAPPYPPQGGNIASEH